MPFHTTINGLAFEVAQKAHQRDRRGDWFTVSPSSSDHVSVVGANAAADAGKGTAKDR